MLLAVVAVVSQPALVVAVEALCVVFLFDLVSSSLAMSVRATRISVRLTFSVVARAISTTDVAELAKTTTTTTTTTATTTTTMVTDVVAVVERGQARDLDKDVFQLLPLVLKLPLAPCGSLLLLPVFVLRVNYQQNVVIVLHLPRVLQDLVLVLAAVATMVVVIDVLVVAVVPELVVAVREVAMVGEVHVVEVVAELVVAVVEVVAELVVAVIYADHFFESVSNSRAMLTSVAVAVDALCVVFLFLLLFLALSVCAWVSAHVAVVSTIVAVVAVLSFLLP